MEDQKKQAEWCRDRRGELYCSACGGYEPFGETNFCPNCGLPMKRLPEQPVKHIGRKDLLRELRSLKVQTGSLACLGCEYKNNCGIHGCAIINEAIQQLEAAQESEEISLENIKGLLGQTLLAFPKTAEDWMKEYPDEINSKQDFIEGMMYGADIVLDYLLDRIEGDGYEV